MDSEIFFVPHALDVHPLGENGEIEILPASDELLSTSKLPCGLPPILPDTNSVLKSYLTNIEKLPIFNLDAVQRYVPSEPDVASLYQVEPCSLQVELAVKRNMTTGKLLGFVEQTKDSCSGTTKTSTSLSRAPGKPEYGVRGSTSSFPFWPGGMDEPWADVLVQKPIDAKLFDCEYLSTPPGFESGMHFERKYPKKGDEVLSKICLTDVLDIEDLVELEPLEQSTLAEEEDKVDLEEALSKKDVNEGDRNLERGLLQIENLPVLKISEAEISEESKHKYKWAVKEDVSQAVEDFYERIPDMAWNFDFELDTFQKKAIIHLENQENVFVAAHTSAGKTVVAEYAIALAKKHMTRVLYTSPIKALSNQKFRDFKAAFGDVGLITGDVSINKEGFCLIMTTEILRSMLYHGSDVVREVEWVIFDEVHYINDKERGVVWEEVFIMLPHHVNLIMLSATVPNTMEFAEWLGGIKKRNIHVISTKKRPVPLVYYLYTGSVGVSQDDMFCILKSNGQLSSQIYNKAVAAKTYSKGKSKDAKGPLQNAKIAKGQKGPPQNAKIAKGPKGHPQNVKMAEEKNVYIGLLEYLHKKNLLPVVCFTFSRRKCSELAYILRSRDLTTESEKSRISTFFKNSIAKLKPEDRVLQQVTTMMDQLVSGYGVHHSGILPILKEVVEMLFQQGLVKVLFATETFAVGVNMPARSVVFDSIQKHDGIERRYLHASEFIQMAGRAGRRGKDETGTVIILCKTDVPEISVLQKILQGSPMKLESQFKLTYSMILNLLKVKSLRIEDVMKKSFCESNTEEKQKKCKKNLDARIDKRTQLHHPDCSLCMSDIKQYCEVFDEMLELQEKVMEKVCSQFINSKSLGRIVSFSNSYHLNIPGIIVKCLDKDKCKVLVAADKCDENMKVKFWTKSFFIPQDTQPKIVDVLFKHVQRISSKQLKLDFELVLKDWRDIEHLKKSPGHCITAAVQDLLNFCQGGFSEAKLSGSRDVDLVASYSKFQNRRCSLETDFNCVKCPLFSKHFDTVWEIYVLDNEVKSLNKEMSVESLKSHPEYLSRKRVLEELGYINAEGNVELKGSVAREMSNHELLITELLVMCVFTKCEPEEIAALLSCMVFQQKCIFSFKDLGLPPNMLNMIKTIEDVADNIEREQRKEGVCEPPFFEQYNFGLSKIVYDWARGISFATIMEEETVNVEEGIVVRCIQRLSELLKDIRSAASLVGDTILAKKMETASNLIKRDIVFAASLYLYTK